MSITNKLRRSAATLAEQIVESQRAVASFETQIDQAEAAAVEAAGEPAEYAKCADRVSRLRGQCEAERERLKRLRQSHSQAVTAERGEQIEKASADHAKKKAARERVWSEAPQAVLEEVDRHIAEIKKLSKAYWGAEAEAASAALRLAELRLEDATERKESGDDGAAAQITECNAEIARQRTRTGRAEGLTRQPPICKCSRPVVFIGGKAFGFGTAAHELETADPRSSICRRVQGA